jgi:hypothetical protein
MLTNEICNRHRLAVEFDQPQMRCVGRAVGLRSANGLLAQRMLGGTWERAVTQVIVMIIADDVALAFSVFSLTVVFIKLRRAYKQNLPDSGVDETC